MNRHERRGEERQRRVRADWLMNTRAGSLSDADLRAARAEVSERLGELAAEGLRRLDRDKSARRHERRHPAETLVNPTRGEG